MQVRKSRLIGTIKNGYEIINSRHIGHDTQYFVRCTKCGHEEWKSRTFVKGAGRCVNCSGGRNYHNAKGYNNERLYQRYQSILRRVNSHDAYKNVPVCEEWIRNYLSFKSWALQNGYRDDLTIDRIDNNKGYFPDNCRWADAKTQANNRRSNVYLELDGENHTIAEWELKLGFPKKVLQQRHRNGWSVEDILLTPYRSRKKWSEMQY